MSIVLATCAALPALDQDDQHLYQALQAAQIPTEIQSWDDPAVDWGRYQLCVIRSTWDYVPRRQEYLAWTERVASQTVLWNPPTLLRWNTDKRYLAELEAKGVPVVPTVWIEAGTPFHAIEWPQAWTQVVVKPVISAAGDDTFRVDRADWNAQQDTIEQLLSARDLMIQPFMSSVQRVGEYAFLFFNGVFSHALIKRPQNGEFRVQVHFGGYNERIQPTANQLDFAEGVMAQLAWPTLYARVDAIEDERGNLLLSELELTEPSMYLALDDQASARFVAAIQQKLALRTPGD